MHFRDDWRTLPDVLEPAQVMQFSDTEATAWTRSWAPGPIIDDDDLQVRDDIAAQIARAYERIGDLFNTSDDDPYNDLPLPPLDNTAEVCGYYDIGEVAIPVFTHQQAGFEQLLSECIDTDFKGWGFLRFFEDAAPPYPTPGVVNALVRFTREQQATPAFHRLHIAIGPARAADAIVAAGPIDEQRRADLIRAHFERNVNRLAYRSLDAFEEAVNQELRQRRTGARGLDAETGLPHIDQSDLPLLPRVERNLKPAVDLAVGRATVLLPAGFGNRLLPPPPVLWTNSVNESTFGHWSLRLAGKGKGKGIIRINRLLRTRPKHVPDEMLAYLIFHELLHHLLPGQGHDAQFRDFEALWPNAERWDLAFDTLHEHWDTRPARYRADWEY